MRVARGTAPGGKSYQPVDHHSICLPSGSHVVAVMVHHLGEACATHRVKAPGLLLKVAFDSGRHVGSDASWRGALCTRFERDLPGMMSHFGFYEHQRSHAFPSEWSALEFDDSGWPNAAEVARPGDAPWGELLARQVPLLSTETVSAAVACTGRWAGPPIGKSKNISDDMTARQRQILSRRAVATPARFQPSGPLEGGTFAVFDFGREVTGHARLRVGGDTADWRLDLGYDETLDTRGLPNPQRTYVQFADRIELAPGDRVAEVYNARGFRYLMVDAQGGAGELLIEAVELDERTVAARAPVRFACSDPSLSAIHRRAWDTIRLCSLDTFVDTPSRER